MIQISLSIKNECDKNVQKRKEKFLLLQKKGNGKSAFKIIYPILKAL